MGVVEVVVVTAAGVASASALCWFVSSVAVGWARHRPDDPDDRSGGSELFEGVGY